MPPSQYLHCGKEGIESTSRSYTHIQPLMSCDIRIVNVDFFLSVVGIYLPDAIVEPFQSLNDYCLKHRIFFYTAKFSLGIEQISSLTIFGLLDDYGKYILNLIVLQEDKYINHIYKNIQSKHEIKLIRAERQGTDPLCRSTEEFWDKLPENYLNELLSKAAADLQ